ncbi:ArsR/SmtB family transcription factor [Pseudohongiella sp.]|uniref:HTH arsR-type domain-containing protein n=1 Tax=marine sediment metagenome TaxID=412755 RepID=A0A0F9YVG0_9ZZZZ|nr:metalloregulator ArsR/SmtB family transcription factor [Pseudohongiella sp.]HDZ08752.1 metalloregulator ArsR/SmtB family transcription factor [Pseudohongiella sp.]HEA62368.1 metalloregulator ArsR/SmtB family transcription factor [Pseudohongiella sp.]
MSTHSQMIDINTQLPIGRTADELARVFKALADPLRLDILRLLRAESFGVLELCRIVDVRQSALSHHLKILARAGLVSTRREGNSIFYRRALLLTDDAMLAVKQSAFAALDELPLRGELAGGIQQIHDERSEQSLLFFERHAERFLEKQELVAEYAHYRDTLRDLLGGLKLPEQARVLEVGPGESPLLSELATRFRHLTALDNSMEMLNRARNSLAQRLGKHSSSNPVDFIHGDTRAALSQGLTFDLLIYNMVLHHIPSPRETFRDCAQLLNNHGTLLLIDLSHHDQDWVRESCGDLWLGFTEQDLDAWAEEAGLDCGQRVYLGQRNGFQVQMRVFTRTF